MEVSTCKGQRVTVVRSGYFGPLFAGYWYTPEQIRALHAGEPAYPALLPDSERDRLDVSAVTADIVDAAEERATNRRALARADLPGLLRSLFGKRPS